MLHKGNTAVLGKLYGSLAWQLSGSLSTQTTTHSSVLSDNSAESYLLLGYQLEISTPHVFHAVPAPGLYLLD